MEKAKKRDEGHLDYDDHRIEVLAALRKTQPSVRTPGTSA